MLRRLPRSLDFELTCDWCGRVIDVLRERPRGRPRRWCGETCRKRAERARTSDKGASPDKSPRVVRTARRSGRGYGSSRALKNPELEQ